MILNSHKPSESWLHLWTEFCTHSEFKIWTNHFKSILQTDTATIIIYCTWIAMSIIYCRQNQQKAPKTSCRKKKKWKKFINDQLSQPDSCHLKTFTWTHWYWQWCWRPAVLQVQARIPWIRQQLRGTPMLLASQDRLLSPAAQKTIQIGNGKVRRCSKRSSQT